MSRKGILFSATLIALAVSFPAAAVPNRNDQKPAYRTINYDFLKSKMDAGKVGELKVWYRQGVLLKVDNINPFLYDIVINGQTVSYNQAVPASLSAALSDRSKSEAAGEAAARRINRDMAEKARDRRGRATPTSETSQELVDNYLNAEGEFRSVMEAIYLLIPTAEKVVLECVGYSDDLTKDAILEKIKVGISSSFDEEFDGPDSLRAGLLLLIGQTRQCWADLQSAYDHLGEDKKGKYREAYETEKDRWTTFQKTDEAVLKKALDNAVGTWRAVVAASFQAVGGPFQADGDELILKITASRKAGVDVRFPTRHVCTDKNVAVLRVRGGLKLDFSTGFIFAGPTDRSYSLRENVYGDNEIVRNDRATEGICAISPGVFIHIYPRTAADMAVAMTVALAINKSSIIDCYLGPSLLIGSSRRIVLNSGIGIRTISTLSGGYREHDVLPSDVGTIPLVNTIHFAYFIGISFNLGGT